MVGPPLTVDTGRRAHTPALPRPRSRGYVREVRNLRRSFVARFLLALLAATFTSVQAIAHGVAHVREAAGASHHDNAAASGLGTRHVVNADAERTTTAQEADLDHAGLHYQPVASRVVLLFLATATSDLVESCDRPMRVRATIPRQLVAHATRARSPAARPRAPPLG